MKYNLLNMTTVKTNQWTVLTTKGQQNIIIYNLYLKTVDK